jgi:curved DNA-binding protein CbpA
VGQVNYYDLLGIDPDAPESEIQAAYLFQIKAFHPDRYDPVKHPAQHVRALFMSQRLNQARDTLIDPASRRAYDAKLRPAEPAAAPPPPPPTQSARPERAAAAQPTPVPCPTGEPAVTINGVSVYPDPEASGFGPPTRLYVVHGTIANRTSAPISVSNVGFYLGAASLDLAPTWDQDTSMLEMSGNPNDIAAHEQITFVARHSVALPEGMSEPFPATVTGLLKYPPASDSPSRTQWLWTAADPACQPER